MKTRNQYLIVVSYTLDRGRHSIERLYYGRSRLSALRQGLEIVRAEAPKEAHTISIEALDSP